MVRMVAILNENGKKIFKKYMYDEEVNNRRGLSRACRGRNGKDPEAKHECVMFCFKEEVLVEMMRCTKHECKKIINQGRRREKPWMEKNNHVGGIMSDIQATLGIPRRWGKYTGLVVFDVDRRNLYVPMKREGGVYAYKNDEKHNRIHKENPLEFPFIGEGITFVYGVKRKGVCWPKEGINEYVLLSGTRMKNVMYYDTISKYCEHRVVGEGRDNNIPR